MASTPPRHDVPLPTKRLNPFGAPGAAASAAKRACLDTAGSPFSTPHGSLDSGSSGSRSPMSSPSGSRSRPSSLSGSDVSGSDVSGSYPSDSDGCCSDVCGPGVCGASSPPPSPAAPTPMHLWDEPRHAPVIGAFQPLRAPATPHPSPHTVHTQPARCYFCRRGAAAAECGRCERAVCEMCARECAYCEKGVCRYCVEVDYRARDEVERCLDCHELHRMCGESDAEEEEGEAGDGRASGDEMEVTGIQRRRSGR